MIGHMGWQFKWKSIPSVAMSLWTISFNRFLLLLQVFTQRFCLYSYICNLIKKNKQRSRERQKFKNAIARNRHLNELKEIVFLTSSLSLYYYVCIWISFSRIVYSSFIIYFFKDPIAVKTNSTNFQYILQYQIAFIVKLTLLHYHLHKCSLFPSLQFLHIFIIESRSTFTSNQISSLNIIYYLNEIIFCKSVIK